MFAEQRRRQILQILDTHGSTTLTELTRLLGASESTVRRDLQEMDSKGLLVRVFGGAMSKNSKTDLREEDVSEKQTINIAEKQRIGKYAAALIKPDDFVYIDAGTTTGSMIPFITEYSAVYVTNAVAHGLELARRGFRVNLVGGEIRGVTEAIVGNAACELQPPISMRRSSKSALWRSPESAMCCVPLINSTLFHRSSSRLLQKQPLSQTAIRMHGTRSRIPSSASGRKRNLHKDDCRKHNNASRQFPRRHALTQ